MTLIFLPPLSSLLPGKTWRITFFYFSSTFNTILTALLKNKLELSAVDQNPIIWIGLSDQPPTVHELAQLGVRQFYSVWYPQGTVQTSVFNGHWRELLPLLTGNFLVFLWFYSLNGLCNCSNVGVKALGSVLLSNVLFVAPVLCVHAG